MVTASSCQGRRWMGPSAEVLRIAVQGVKRVGQELGQVAEPKEPISPMGAVSDVGTACPALLGHSPLVGRAASQVRRAAAERGHVLILAEPGLDAEEG